MSSRTRRTPHLLLAGALALGIPCAHAADAPPSQDPPFKHYIGYHGPDGTQVYRDCNPPIEWDEKTGKNIHWKTQLPDYGMGSPVVFRGRVFVTSAPGYQNAFPVLNCLDAGTGKVLWQREIDHLPAVIPDAAEQEHVRKTWRSHLLSGVPIEDKNLLAKLRKYEIRTPLRDGWAPGPDFPTPCTDGEFVYVSTGWRAHACYDFDGNLQWLKWVPGKGKLDAGAWDAWRSPLIWNGLYVVDMYDYIRAFDKKTGEVRWEVQRSAIGANVRYRNNTALAPGDAMHFSPKLCRVGDTDLLWCGGPAVVRLADGKPLKIEGWKNGGVIVAVNTDSPDMIFLGGGHYHGAWANGGLDAFPPPVALKLVLEDDTIRPQVLWSKLGEIPVCTDWGMLAYHDGKVFVSGHSPEGHFNKEVPEFVEKTKKHLSQGKYRAAGIIEAATGKVLGGLDADGRPRPSAQATAHTAHVYAIAGGRIYGATSGGKGTKSDEPAECVLEVFDVSGKRLANNPLYGPRIEGEFKKMHTLGRGIPNSFSYAPSLAVSGDRLFVRSYHHVYCIRERK